MDQQLLKKPFSEVTEEEWKQVQQAMNIKPSVALSKATFDHPVRQDGLALDLRFIEPYGTTSPTLRIPDEFVHPVPSDFLCGHLLNARKVFVINNEKSYRILIDAILMEVLGNEFKDNFYGFCDVQNDWEGTGFRYTGNADYMLGSCKHKSVESLDSLLLIKVARKGWPSLFDDAVAQVICEAGCLLKRRLAAGKVTPVFAALTNGIYFRFFAIDTDGVVYSSGLAPLGLGIGPFGDYTDSPTLSEILRWFTWFTSSIKSLSADLTAEKVEDSLNELRRCFGPKNPVSSKKVKIEKN